MKPEEPTVTWRLFQLELGLDESVSSLRRRACRRIGLEPARLRGLRIARRSLDARRRGGGRRLRYIANVDLCADADFRSAALERELRAGRVRPAREPASLELDAIHPSMGAGEVAVLGAGPAGLFAALTLARNGTRALVLDRGPAVRERTREVVAFHRTRVPNPEANLLFAEGGAGTYSDGKIYTRVDDALEVPLLEELVACGAPPDICFDSQAHIGTDRLHRILPRLRARLEELGCRFRFGVRVDGLVLSGSGRVRALRTAEGEIPCDALILAPGHSARDTWSWLREQGVPFEPRPFQLGVRIEHPQELIDRGRFGGAAGAEGLGAASYNLVCRARPKAPGAHSFCMCPGGRIVAAVHGPGQLCTNGMSGSTRASGRASAALVTTFGPADYGSGDFDGVRLQEELERRFFEAGGGDFAAPAQAAPDFLAGRRSRGPLRSTYTFGVVPGRLDELLPARARDAIGRALLEFGRRLPGFAGEGGLLVGVESRSCSPVRIPRDGETRLARGWLNLYPAGEGAGHAGGIVSAALDGARSARALLAQGLPAAGAGTRKPDELDRADGPR